MHICLPACNTACSRHHESYSFRHCPRDIPFRALPEIRPSAFGTIPYLGCSLRPPLHHHHSPIHSPDGTSDLRCNTTATFPCPSLRGVGTAVSSLRMGSPHHWTSRSMQGMEPPHDCERGHYHLAPPLIEGCGRHIITHHMHHLEDGLSVSSDQQKQVGQGTSPPPRPPLFLPTGSLRH